MNKLHFTCFLLLSSLLAYSQFPGPGEPLFDTDGKPINAHGGGILYFGGNYYWFGEMKGSGKTGHLAMAGVSCYKSGDLAHWQNKGLALKMIQDTSSMLQPGCILERPKVIYNPVTKKFVMWFHHELKGMGYSAALTGLAIADKPEGPYQYIKSVRPHQNVWPSNFSEAEQDATENIVLAKDDKDRKAKVVQGAILRRDLAAGQMSRDMTLYVDDDGTAYHIAASEDNQTLHISKLSDDFTSFTNEYYRVLPGGSNEAPVLFKYKRKYYLITSGTTGWAPNAARCFSSDHIEGPWTALGNPVQGTNEEKATTFHSQGTYIFRRPGKRNSFVFMADKWNPENLRDSRCLFLPLTVENDKPVISANNQ